MKTKAEGMAITADLVETIAYRSDNPSFQSVKFREVLSDFRKYKCRTPNKATLDVDSEVEMIKRKLKLAD